MYLGINFNNGKIIDGDEEYPMRLEGFPIYSSGSTGDSYSLVREIVYEIIAEDFVALTLYQPQKGQVVRVPITVPNGNSTATLYAWYEVESVSLEREGAPFQRGNTTFIHVRAKTNLTLITPPDTSENPRTYTDPWDLPPYNFKMGTEFIDDSVNYFWNAATEQYEPFVNTAGVPLQVAGTRPLVRITFSYNLQYFEPSWAYQWAGCVNTEQVEICGITFEPGQVKLESMSFECCKESREVVTPASGDTPETVTGYDVNYTRCDVALLVDPRDEFNTSGIHGFIREYLNSGVHILRNDGLHRLWSGTATLDLLEDTIDALEAAQEQEATPERASAISSLTAQYSAISAAMLENYQVEHPSASTLPTSELTKTITLYGTAAEMAMFADAEEVTENMFLNEDGSGVMQVGTDGRQKPSFKTGYIDRLANFSEINSVGLPTYPPYIWNFVEVPAPEQNSNA